LSEGDTTPAYICRSTEGAKPVEWQANYFAACLLMPRKMVNSAWEACHGSLKPIALDDLRTKQREIVTAEVLRRVAVKPSDDALDNMLLEHCSRPLAGKFHVSPEAMRIRLEQLKLLVRRKEASLFD
jgi:Zn-dependent peptidase ImmA (M78 family)